MHSIFISSTFRDMQKERDIIRETVLPRLDAFARSNGDTIRIEDLRWGIDTSKDDSSVNILNVCFDAILDTNPLMIALIGDRYGTTVDTGAIKTSMLNRKERISEYKESSITELELDYALALNPSQIPCLFFFRKIVIPDSLEKDHPEVWSIYHEGDEDALNRASCLKERIRELYPNRVFEYAVSWDPVKRELTGWDDFADLAEQKIKNVLKTNLEYSESSRKNEFDLARSNFAYSFQQDSLPITTDQEFTNNGRQLRYLMSRKWCDRLTGYYIQSGDQFESSILMASVAHEWIREGVQVIPFDCGVSRDAHDFFFFVKYICHELSCFLGKQDDFMKLYETVYKTEYEDGSDCDEIMEYWLDMYEAEGGEDLIVIVRNWQLTDYGDIQYWYPNKEHPGKIHWVFSSTEGITWDGERIYFNRNIMNGDKGFFDPSFVIDSYMQKNHKQLADPVKDCIIEKAKGKPLSYLMTILDRFMRMNEADYKTINSYGGDGNAINKYQDELISGLPDDRNKVINVVVDNLMEELGRSFVSSILSIACAVPYPISSGYLMHLLEKHGIKWNQMDYSILKNRLAGVLQDNIEDALFIKDAVYKEYWRINNREQVSMLEKELLDEAIPYLSSGIEERYASHYYRHDLEKSGRSEESDEYSQYVIPSITGYYTGQLDSCSIRLLSDGTDDEKAEEIIHFCFLELGASRELKRFNSGLNDGYFEEAQDRMTDVFSHCSNSNASHIISELIDYYNECVISHFRERENKAKETISDIFNSFGNSIEEELKDELLQLDILEV